jgi:hypothetical protein
VEELRERRADLCRLTPDRALVERLISDGRLERVEPGWVTAPASA